MAATIFLTSPMTIEGARVVDAASIGSRQVRLALAFLVINRGRAVPRPQLADLLGPTAGRPGIMGRPPRRSACPGPMTTR